MRKKLVLIDGHSIINRAFYGVPDLTNSSGLHTNAVYGFLNILFRLLEEEKPDYLVVAFDEHAPTFRHEVYSAYKGTRKGMPDELREQVPVLKDVLSAMDVVCISHPGWEADDILGSLAKKAEREGMDVALVSGDRDLLQISSEHICIRIPKTKGGKTTIENYYPQDVVAAYQVTPKQFIELKALMGDTSDNIPGVPKVGEKTAIELMTTYGSLEGIYSHLEEITKKAVRESLRENRELADLSLFLATIKTDCELDLKWEAAAAEGYFTPAAYEWMKKLEFHKFLDRFSVDAASGARQEELATEISVFNTVDSFLSFAMEAAKQDVISLHILQENREILGACIGMQNRAGEKTMDTAADASGTKCQIGYFILPSDGDDATCIARQNTLVEGLKELSAKAKQISFFDIKSQFAFLRQDGTDRYFDILIGAYLLNPLKNDYDVVSISGEHLGRIIPDRKELLGKLSLQEALLQIPEQVQKLAVDTALTCLLSYPVLLQKLQDTGMEKLMREIEMPLTLVLYDMEREGVCVRKDELARYAGELSGRIEELEKSIHEQAGNDFNINSPKQLGEILFEQMGLPGGKKTKTGYSTAADVLEKLAPEVPFVRDILEYRGLTKLKSTYADGLSSYIEEDGRIHTNFNQTITATGRISSTEPNLQNIPIRTQLGRELRKVFVPKEGFLFVDADYSQIELRILASLSEDEQLIDAYHKEQDIHRMTASKVFHVPFEEVTDLQRRNAKAVNFGIVYGISSFGLSQDLSISKKEAAAYIEQYFLTYPGIKAFLDQCVQDARDKGYITTIYGRRRPVPELASSNFMQRSFGERVAMNSPIQGAAADIMKIAMISVWSEIRNRNLKSRLLLQVHDELVIETAPDELDTIKELLARNMKEAGQLAVTLEVGMEQGNNWYEAH